MLATLISFSNEIGNLCSTLGGVDVAEVMRGVHLARYFNSHAADGPRVQAGISSFLWAGCGYGGSCLPKDTKALSAHGAAHGMPMPLFDAVRMRPTAQPARMLKLLESWASLRWPACGWRCSGWHSRKIPPTCASRRRSRWPACCSRSGAIVSGYDPVARETAGAAAAVRLVESLAEAAREADALLLVTRWAEFRRLPELLAALSAAATGEHGRRIIARPRCHVTRASALMAPTTGGRGKP